MCAIPGHQTRMTLVAGLLILALWSAPVFSAEFVSPIPSEDLKFISDWTKLSVDQLIQYEAGSSSEKLVRDLTKIVFSQKHLSWPLAIKLVKLRTGSSWISDDYLSPAMTKQTDQSLLVYPAMQLFSSLKSSQDSSVTPSLNTTTDVLNNVASRHMTYGQAAVLVDALKSKDSKAQIPQSYLFTTPSDTILRDASLNILSLLVDAPKMFPSQRRALYQKLVKSSVGQFVSTVTVNDVEESMLELMPPSTFKANIGDIRDNIRKLSAQEMVNVAYFPNALLTAWQEEIQSSSGLTATQPYLAIRGLSCNSLLNVDPATIPDIAAAYNSHVMDQHPERLKTLPLSLCKCFVHSLKLYLTSKVATSSTTDPSINDIMNALSISDIKAFGGLILAGLKPQEVKLIRDSNVKSEVIRAIGKISPAELMPIVHPDKLQSFMEIGLDNQPTVNLDDLQKLGTLSYFLPTNVWSFSSSAIIKSFFEKSLKMPHHKCVCLPKNVAYSVKEALIKAFGSPSTWSATTLATLEDLLVVLDSNSVDSLNAKALVSALPFLLQNKTFHDRHYDQFPGFVGQVSFAEACGSWLEIDEDSKAFRAADEKLSRTYLLASQLLVNLAWSDATSRVRRQAATFTDIFVSSLHDKTAKIVESRYRDKSLTQDQLLTIRDMIDELTNTTQANVIKVLGLNQTPEDVEAFVREGINSGNVTTDQINSIMTYAKEAQKNYVVKMTKVLGLTGKDLEVTDQELCDFLGNKNCSTPAPIKQFVTLPPTTPSTSIKPSTVTVAPSVTTPAATVTMLPVTTPATTAAAPVSLPALVFNFESYDGVVPIFELKATDKLPEKLTCHGILAAGAAASALKAKDLEAWSSKQVVNCMEVLGSIDASRDTKLEIWNLIKAKMALPQNGPMMILQRNLLEAAAIISPDTLSYNLVDSLEPLSLLADFDLNHDVIVSLADNILAANPSLSKTDTTFDESTMFRLESLKHILCGFPVDFVKKLVRSSVDRRALLHSLGRMRFCRNDAVLAALATDAKTLIPQPWKASDVLSLGVIVSGLIPDDLASLDNVALGGVTASAVSQFTSEHVKSLSAEKLMAIPREALSVLKISQLPLASTGLLSSMQIQALRSSFGNSSAFAQHILMYPTSGTGDRAEAVSTSTRGASSAFSAVKNVVATLTLISVVFAIL